MKAAENLKILSSFLLQNVGVIDGRYIHLEEFTELWFKVKC
jgi:hypothetical protein